MNGSRPNCPQGCACRAFARLGRDLLAGSVSAVSPNGLASASPLTGKPCRCRGLVRPGPASCLNGG